MLSSLAALASRGLPYRSLLPTFPLLILQAATCAIVFFGGSWHDGAVAALCGAVTGVIEWALSKTGKVGGVITDVSVGAATGAIAGAFYRFHDPTYCITSITLGTLYWFFYGTAFVIGILEIIGD
jgi:uncharacterized membrane protein YjjP (DUF1212 family)